MINGNRLAARAGAGDAGAGLCNRRSTHAQQAPGRNASGLACKTRTWEFTYHKRYGFGYYQLILTSAFFVFPPRRLAVWLGVPL